MVVGFFPGLLLGNNFNEKTVKIRTVEVRENTHAETVLVAAGQHFQNSE